MVEGLEIPLGPIVTGKESIRLPSGLSLRYPQLTQDEAGEASYWNGKHRASLHGGVLTENLVQALARVVVSDQLLEIAGHGYRVVTTTHDEIALCVRDEVAQEAYETLLKIMKTAPSWAPGLPLAAEGGISKRYGDAK
jgi:DNA polymerase